MKQNRSNRAFTLIELAAVVATVGALIGLAAPAAHKQRGLSRVVASQANLYALGQGSANYASDNDNRIFSYSWTGGNDYIVAGKANPVRPSSDSKAFAFQAQDIARRRTGRITGQDRIKNLEARLMPRRYSHFVLFDYMNIDFPSPLAASPFDHNLLTWQQDPLYAEDELVPFAHGNTGQPGVVYDAGWINGGILQIWPYSSSYQTVPAAWNPDRNSATGNSWSPIPDDPHLFMGGTNIRMGNRFYDEVSFPSQKVHMFEEFDGYSLHGGIYYAYPDAQVTKLMFDGSINNHLTEDANTGWDPGDPKVDFLQAYLALDTFPLPRYDLNGDANHLWFRWTRDGLWGVDYGPDQPLNRPQRP